MFQRFFVSRKAYDSDVRALRDTLSEVNKQLREQEGEKGVLKNSLKGRDIQIQMLTREVEQLGKRLKGKVVERDLQEYMEPVPKDETGRREYMAQVAGLYEGALKGKLQHLHLQFRNQTGMFPLTERETDFFRACINVVGLLMDWGEECTNEYHSNIATANKMETSDAFSSSEGDEAVKNIKSKLEE
jgi:hypothetical protein